MGSSYGGGPRDECLITEHRKETAPNDKRHGVVRLDVFGSAATGSFHIERCDVDFIVDLGLHDARGGDGFSPGFDRGGIESRRRDWRWQGRTACDDLGSVHGLRDPIARLPSGRSADAPMLRPTTSEHGRDWEEGSPSRKRVTPATRGRQERPPPCGTGPRVFRGCW